MVLLDKYISFLEEIHYLHSEKKSDNRSYWIVVNKLSANFVMS